MKHQARKRFGQNFLNDAGVIDRMIASIAPHDDDVFVEIGPGQGALTRPLLEAGVQLNAVEIDRDLAAMLRERLAGFGEQFRLLEGDALRQPLTAFAPPDQPLRIVGNLPYNLSTPMLFHLTEPGVCEITDLHLLLQKEVVERMAAGPGSRAYGRLSVMIQARCQVEPLFDVPPQAFTPAPQVTSRYVRLLPRPCPALADVDDDCLHQVVAAAFAQRRKTLRNALNGILHAQAIEAVGIDPSTRAEQISLEGYGALARARFSQINTAGE